MQELTDDEITRLPNIAESEKVMAILSGIPEGVSTHRVTFEVMVNLDNEKGIIPAIFKAQKAMEAILTKWGARSVYRIKDVRLSQ